MDRSEDRGHTPTRDITVTDAKNISTDVGPRKPTPFPKHLRPAQPSSFPPYPNFPTLSLPAPSPPPLDRHLRILQRPDTCSMGGIHDRLEDAIEEARTADSIQEDQDEWERYSVNTSSPHPVTGLERESQSDTGQDSSICRHDVPDCSESRLETMAQSGQESDETELGSSSAEEGQISLLELVAEQARRSREPVVSTKQLLVTVTSSSAPLQSSTASHTLDGDSPAEIHVDIDGSSGSSYFFLDQNLPGQYSASQEPSTESVNTNSSPDVDAENGSTAVNVVDDKNVARQGKVAGKDSDIDNDGENIGSVDNTAVSNTGENEVADSTVADTDVLNIVTETGVETNVAHAKSEFTDVVSTDAVITSGETGSNDSFVADIISETGTADHTAAYTAECSGGRNNGVRNEGFVPVSDSTLADTDSVTPNVAGSDVAVTGDVSAINSDISNDGVTGINLLTRTQPSPKLRVGQCAHERSNDASGVDGDVGSAHTDASLRINPLMLTSPSALLRGGRCERKKVNNVHANLMTTLLSGGSHTDTVDSEVDGGASSESSVVEETCGVSSDVTETFLTAHARGQNRRLSDVKFSEFKCGDVKPSSVPATDIQENDGKTSDTKTTVVTSGVVKFNDVKCCNAQRHAVQLNNVKPINVESGDVPSDVRFSDAPPLHQLEPERWPDVNWYQPVEDDDEEEMDAQFFQDMDWLSNMNAPQPDPALLNMWTTLEVIPSISPTPPEGNSDDEDNGDKKRPIFSLPTIDDVINAYERVTSWWVFAVFWAAVLMIVSTACSRLATIASRWWPGTNTQWIRAMFGFVSLIFHLIMGGGYLFLTGVCTVIILVKTFLVIKINQLFGLCRKMWARTRYVFRVVFLTFAYPDHIVWFIVPDGFHWTNLERLQEARFFYLEYISPYLYIPRTITCALYDAWTGFSQTASPVVGLLRGLVSKIVWLVFLPYRLAWSQFLWAVSLQFAIFSFCMGVALYLLGCMVVNRFTIWLYDMFVDTTWSLVRFHLSCVQSVLGFYRSIFQAVLGFFQSVRRLFLSCFQSVLGFYLSIVQWVLGFFCSIFLSFLGFFLSVIHSVFSLFLTVGALVKHSVTLVRSVFETARRVFNALMNCMMWWTGVLTILKNVRESVSRVFTAVKKYVLWWTGIRGAMRELCYLFASLLNGLRQVISSLTGASHRVRRYDSGKIGRL